MYIARLASWNAFQALSSAFSVSSPAFIRAQAKEEAEAQIAEAKQIREDADTYAADKRKEADETAAEIVDKASREAAAQIEERRKAAQTELDGLHKRIGELQSREADITQRVSELRSMFANAFAGFGFGVDNQHSTDSMSVVNAFVESDNKADGDQDDDVLIESTEEPAQPAATPTVPPLDAPAAAEQGTAEQDADAQDDGHDQAAETEVIAVAQENDRSMVSEGAPVFDQRDNQVVDDEDGAINDDTQLSHDQ